MSYQVSIPIPNEADSGVCTAYYLIRLRKASDSAWQQMPNQFGSPIIITNLIDGQNYVAELRRACCEGQISDPFTVDIVSPGLQPPAMFTATGIVNGIRLSWLEPAEEPPLTYILERAVLANFDDPDAELTDIYTGAWVDHYDDTPLVSSIVYYYRIKATSDGYDDSGYSVAHATPILT